MTIKLIYPLLTGFLLFTASLLTAQSESFFESYHTDKQVQEYMETIQNKNSTIARLHKLAVSPGGKPVTLIEIGPDKKDCPAIFVGANFEGNLPLATEGALYLVKMLMDSTDYTREIKWYILPQPNPDASEDFFASMKTGLPVNGFDINNDADNQLNEDDFEDLNNDGYITQMRVKDMEGTHIISSNDPRIMNRADAKKGQRGIYKIYTEGTDNDLDGKYNEDGKGGINPGISFPHLFPKTKKEAGAFPGQTPEVYGILRFIYDHPEIAMVFTLGSSDFCTVPPKGGRKGGANLQSIKIPSRYAKMMNADPEKTYTMDQVVEMMKKIVPPGMEVTPTMIAGFLGLGAAVNPLEDDLKFYTEFSEKYKDYLKKKEFNSEILPPVPAKDGSFELWSYYHLGVPSFSMNLFRIPKVKEEKKEGKEALTLEEAGKLSTEDFIKLGEHKIDTFLLANNAPSRFKAKNVIEMMESGKLAPAQMIEMLKKIPKKEKEDELSERDKALLAWSDQKDEKGFVKWQNVDHPTLGEVEIGGYVPYFETTPEPDKIAHYASKQIPWLLELSKKLPSLKFAGNKITELGKGIYKVELYVENESVLAYPIAMGSRNNQPAPVVVVLEGEFELLEGNKRAPLGAIGGNQVKKLSWIVKSKKGSEIKAIIESAVFTNVVKTFKTDN